MYCDRQLTGHDQMTVENNGLFSRLLPSSGAVQCDGAVVGRNRSVSSWPVRSAVQVPIDRDLP